MSSYRCPTPRPSAPAAQRSVRLLTRYALTLLAALVFALGGLPMALLGPAATAFAQGSGTLSVRVYLDADRDGIDDGAPNDTAIAGQQVAVYSIDDRLVAQTFTDNGGLAVFNNLPLGEYRVEVSAPANAVVSVPGVAFTNPGLVFRKALTLGAPTATAAVGLRSLSGGVDSGAPLGRRTLDTRVWDDRDSDGVQDADEPGLSGLTVQLFNVSGTATLTATEAPDGRYIFLDAQITESNTIRVTAGLSSTYGLTQQDVAVNAVDQRDSDGSLADLPIVQASAFGPLPAFQGVNDDSIDIGLTQAAVSGFVFRDVNANGSFNTGADARLDGITVELLDGGGTPVFTTTTRTELGSGGASGVYRFTGVPTGTYTLRIPSAEFQSGAALFGAANSPNAAGGDQGSPDGVIPATPATAVISGPFTLDLSDVAAGSNTRTNGHFGFFKGSVGDFVWYDINRDGSTSGETALGQNGIRVFVDDGRGGGIAGNGIRETSELSATTSNDPLSGLAGFYRFDDLPLGLTTTVVLDPANFLPGGLLEGVSVGNAVAGTNSLSQTYYFTSTAVLTDTAPNDFGVDFGLTRSDIGNRAFIDANGNRLFDPVEDGIPGVTVELRRASNDSLVITATTGITGAYTLPNLPALGYYAVFNLATAVPTYTNYIASLKPVTATVDPAETTLIDYTDLISPALSATSWRTDVFTPALGIVNNGVDAGFYLPTTVAGRAFFDTDGDDLDSATPEPGMRGVTVRLLNAADTSVVSTTTTALSDTGAYTFSNVAPGPYLVEFVNPVTTTFDLITGTTELTSTNPLASDVETIEADGAGRTGTLSVLSGTPIDELDAGYQGRGAVSGHVFLDDNGSDTQDAGDTSLAGATAALTVTANLPNLVATYSAVVSPTTTTATDPNYGFALLPFGTGVTYTLAISPPVAVPADRPYLPSVANVGGDDDLDSDGPDLVITQTAELLSFDQGFYQEALVTARVFREIETTAAAIDNQFDGADDEGLLGASVALEAITGTLVLTETTIDATGLVTFSVKPGNYRLNLDASSVAAGLLPSPGHTDPITVTNNPLGSGDDSLSDTAGANSFGFFTPASVSGTVFFDRDEDNQKAGEPGLGGVGVLLEGPSGPLTATTDLSGVYTVTGLLPGDYTATFTNPDTLNFAFITLGDSDVISAGNVLTSATALDGVAVAYGAPVSGVDAGLVGRSQVAGLVFEDLDADGVQNDGPPQPAVSGVTVTLGLDVSLPGLLTTTLTRELTTDATGVYTFTGLPGDPGAISDTAVFSLTFTPPTVTRPWLLTTADVGSNTTDSDSELSGQSLPRGTVTETVELRDQGYYRNAQVTARVFEETVSPVNNRFDDGVTGDAGLTGVDVRLETITGTLVLTETTIDATGLVTFEVRPGSYRLNLDEADVAAGLVPSPNHTDPVTVTGNPLLSNEDSDTDNAGANSFGFYSPATVTGTVFFDRDLDSRKTGEPGFGGVELTLSDGTTTLTTTTTATGAYTFTNLISNTYTLTVTNPDAANFDFVSGGDSVVSAGGTASITITYGVELGDQDVGLVGKTSVTGLAFVDGDGDGLSGGANDRGLPGVTVTLTLDLSVPGLNTQITRTEVATSTAGISGTYGFAGLPGDPDGPGASTASFTLTFTAPDATPPWQLTTAEVGDLVPDEDTSATDSDDELSGQSLDRGADEARDQGYFQAATVTARVFEESSSPINNQYNDGGATGDTGIAGVRVSLETITGTLVLSDTSLATGLVTFTVAPGSYQLNIDETDPDLANFNPSPGHSDPVTITTSSGAGLLLSDESSETDNAGANSFGYFRTGTITGTVFFDRDLDARKLGEPGVEGVEVGLVGATTAYTTTTDATGAYTLTDLISDTYTLTITNPDTLNFAFVTGGDSVIDASGVATVTVGYGADLGDQDAGLVGRSSVIGRTFVDLNANGSSEGDSDPGLPGVTVTLTLDVSLPGLTTQISRTTVATSTAGISGTYGFVGLPGSSTYSVTFTAPTATPPWQLTTADAAGVPDTENSDGALTGQTLATNTADERDQGYFQDVSVTGLVFEETTGAADNDFVSGDLPLAGVEVRLETITGTLVLSQTTDATGVVSFTARPGVDYQLNLDEGAAALAGLAPSEPNYTNPLTVTGNTLLSGQSSPADATPGANSFGFFRTSTITGAVFFDRDLNGLKQGEPGVEGVEVALLQGASVVSTTTTTATGAYSFTGVVSNSYTLVFTNPDTNNFAFFTGGDSDLATAGAVTTSTIDLGAVGFGASLGDRDAGLRGLAAVGGRSFIDDNADGDSELDTDLPLAGVTVTLTLDVGLTGQLTTTITRTTVTTATGVYSFTGLPGGSSNFDLSFTPPDPTWQLTTAEATGDESADSDNELTNQPLSAGGQEERDQGFFQNATIVARVFDERVTVNNSFEPGEVGILGATVTITPTAVSGGGLSDATGQITFTVRPGVYTLSGPDLTADGFTPAPTNTLTLVVTTTSGLSEAAPFGYYKPNTLLGTAWFDSSRDGLLDLGEPGMEAITVTLETGDGASQIDTAVTDATGTYTITGVEPSGINGAPADYRLCFSRTADFTYTIRSGLTAGDGNNDANPDGCSDPFTVLGSNGTLTTTDAGYLGFNSVGDLVWNDLNNDGVQDAGEDGLAGAVVTLAISTTGVINSSDPVVTMTGTSTTSLDLAANYAVTGAPPATGFRVVSVTPPVGFVPTVANVVTTTEALDSDAPGDSFGALPPDNVDVDFGFTGVTSVGDLVWLDLNGDGLYDAASEAGVPGVRVDLLRGSSVISTTTTGSGARAGIYSFEELTPGAYSLRFVAPAGYVFTNNGAGAIATDGDNDARSDGTTVAFTLSGGQQLFSVDAGLRGGASIAGLVWVDENRNNQRDANESERIAGVQVTLSLTPTLTPSRPLTLATTTSGDGSYSFANLPAGSAAVSFTQPAGVFPVTPNVGPDATDSDGPVAAVSVAAGAQVRNVDMGYRERGLFVFFPVLHGKVAKAELSGTFTVTPASPRGGAPAEVSVTVTNSGDAPATNFWVDLYINPSRPPVVNDRWNDICGATPQPCLGIAWFYTGVLQPGQSVTLVSTATSETNPNGYLREASIWPGYFLFGTSKLYIYVDSWNRDESGAIRDPNGAVGEQDETNNRAEQTITVTLGEPPASPEVVNGAVIDRATLRR